MKKENKFAGSNKPVFNGDEQRKVVAENEHLLKMFKKVKSVEGWNGMREQVKADFVGTNLQKLMLFGYIDGVLFPKLMIRGE